MTSLQALTKSSLFSSLSFLTATGSIGLSADALFFGTNVSFDVTPSVGNSGAPKSALSSSYKGLKYFHGYFSRLN